MRRLFATCTLTTSLLVATAMPAFAHAGFLEASAPADSSETLTLRVPGERTGQRTMLVETKVPASFGFAACVAPPDFTCGADTQTDGSTVVLFQRTGGEADTDLQYSFELQTPSKVGSYRFPTIQTYSGKDSAGNREEFWTGANSPALSVTPSGTAVVTDDDPQDHESTSQTASADDAGVDASDSDTGDTGLPATLLPAGDDATEDAADTGEDAAVTTEIAADEASSEGEGSGLLLLVLAGVVVLGVGTGLTIRQKMQA